MFALALLCWLAAGARAWLPTVNISKSTEDLINTDATNKTVTLVRYLDSNSCSCNRVNNVCDYLCCCDASCNPSIVAQWRKDGKCKSEFVEAMQSYYCDETILALTPKLREMNTCKPFSSSFALPQYLLHRV